MYTFSWDGRQIIIEKINGKRVQFACVRKWKAEFMEHLVVNANTGSIYEQTDDTEHILEHVDDINNFTPEY